MHVALSAGHVIRNEAKASFLIPVNTVINLQVDSGAFCIPPFMGYILAHVGDFEYDRSLKVISAALKVSVDAIDHFVKQLINNKESKEFKISDNLSVVLPAMLLTQYAGRPDTTVYEDCAFDGLGEYNIKRPSAPISANLMVTTRCSTDCVYCYANRKLAPVLGTEKLLDLIRELHALGTVNVTLTGGDIFAHPDWKKILKCVRDYGYQPFLSTKTPLTAENLKLLRGLGYKEIQFSLDSVEPDTLRRLVNVRDGYLDNITTFLQAASECGLKVLVRSVLTKLNASKESISSLYTYLSGFDCIKEWVMTPAFFSKYKETEYKWLEVNNDDLIWVHEFTRRQDLAFRIGLNKISEKGYELKKFGTIEEYVCRNQICMGNTTGISILANGDCSVCEMLYDSPEYILGNVNDSSIREIWNSEKAMQLYTMAQQQFPQASPCRQCSVFEKCRNGFGKRVCYADIAKTGKTKYDPDPRCPHAENIDLIL